MRNLPSIKIDAFVYPILIKFAGKEAVSIHAHVLKLGFDSDSYVRNAVMDMYAKHGPIELARKLFDEMPERAIADWNSMVSGYWKWGYSDEANRLFHYMPEKNVVSWTAMVSGCAKGGDLEMARMYFDMMSEKSVVSWNAMISGYAQKGFAEEAIELFNEMNDTGIKPDETTWVTVISSCSERGDPQLAKSLVGSLDQRRISLNCFVKTALLDMYAKCGDIATSQLIFEEMGTQRTPVSWNAMLSAYARIGDIWSARNLFNEMPERNVVTWNSMIAGYAQNGQSALAVELFKEMTMLKDLKPDEVTMVSVISACGHIGALELGKWITRFATERGINLSISGYNSLISMYSRCGSMEDAKRVFCEMQTRDVVSYNSLIAGFAIHGYGTEAIQLLLKMKANGIEPDRITYVGVLMACSHGGLSKEGWQIFNSIKTPSVDHYACMVDLLGRVGQLDEAKKLVNGMPMMPHAGVYGALLNASCIHKNVELGEYAAYKLFALEPENSGNYSLLAKIYASAGRWQDATRIMGTMKMMGVKKTAGCSWVEHDGEVYQFIAGDRSHKQMAEIHRILEELRKKMRSLGYVADTNFVLRDVEGEEKEEMVGTHSEKLAIGFALIMSEAGTVIRVVKNLRVCGDCHTAIKMIAKVTGREIIVRDNNRFHCFKDGDCSCKDYW
ncbi:Pentatricopeptide repeat-containing protein [Thalictrum thalictroides]|uniref:Pentatricopeptide repeat-containing protein n=1 Tax=Thalictrum thalictroides TaxID=46969 RepID=A0A7J6UVN9_THATH|nr:Pentatricopeptide repeat-containing protein [Thalictrum thalictroides]